MTRTIIKDSERTKCEIWTRVMGYHRPVTEFNIGKQSEYAERTVFQEIVAIKALPDIAVA
ncbi:MAG: anaerobic ribonucleoside-triphosphate reductase [Fibrobacterales bacterium]